MYMEKRRMFNEILKQKIIDILLIIINISFYLAKKYISKEKSTEKLLLEKTLFKCKIWDCFVEFNYELLSLIYNFETSEYLNYITDKKYNTFIDIWSNIWRLSWLNLKFSDTNNIILCDPNPFVFNFSKNFFIKNTKSNKNVLFINNAISNKSESLNFFVVNKNELNWIWSIYEENLPNENKKKLEINSISFSELIKQIKLELWLILIKIDVEWHEKIVLESILEYFSYTNDINELTILVEVWDRNIEELTTYLKTSKYFNEIKKISYNDYVIILKK